MMEREESEPATDDLDVSMTQSAQFLFIPFPLAGFLGVGMPASGIYWHTWKVVFVFPPLWVLAAVLMKRDHNILSVLHTKVRLLRTWLTAYRWGGWTVALPASHKGPSDAV